MNGSGSRRRILVAVRHGQTDWNLQHRFQGRLDIPLNAAGYGQAEAVAARLAGFSFDAAYSSPLRRALSTAHVIAGNVPVAIDNRLVEIDHGTWQGKTKHDIAERWPHRWWQWTNEPQRFTPSGGESSECVRKRIENFLSTMNGNRILCVSHGVVIQTLLSMLVGGRYVEHREYEPQNGSIHSLHFQNDTVVDYAIDRIA